MGASLVEVGHGWVRD